MFLKIGILLLLAGSYLLMNGIWMIFLSPNKKMQMAYLMAKPPSELTQSEKEEVMFYKIECFLLRASPYLITVGILLTIIGIIKN
jgi:hypothetical protein